MPVPTAQGMAVRVVGRVAAPAAREEQPFTPMKYSG
jgi:hypothetical protein